jgi:hypothetical protein
MRETILDRTGRIYHFPRHPKLDRLLTNYDPEIGYFKVPMKRRNARALRSSLFGTIGLRKDTPSGYGVRVYPLPSGWTLRLTYYDQPFGWSEAGDVDAEFIPPTMNEWPPPPRWPGVLAA